MLVSNLHPGTIYTVSRAGMFRSTDWGDHWMYVHLEPMNAKKQIYCRYIREVPGDPKSIWVAAGADFQSNVGALFHSNDGGASWERVDIGFELKNTMGCIAFDERNPSRMYCASQNGQVFASHDGGQSWSSHPLPEGAAQVYSLACS